MEKDSEKVLKFLQNGNLLPLAFLGDAIHTLFVREKLLGSSQTMNKYASLSSTLCKASTQAAALKQIMPDLSEEESEIVRRARNAKPKHTAKNATSADYSYATAFEALVGYLYIKDEKQRLQEILEKSVKIGENNAN